MPLCETIIKLVKNPGYLPTWLKIKKIHSLPRFHEFYTNLLGPKLKAIDSDSLIFMHHEIFEKEIYKFKTDNPIPLIIDCGANIGLSVIYFKKLYPNTKIIAFEPDQRAFDALTFNVKNFSLTDVELIPKAVWTKSDKLNFFSQGADGGRLALSSDTNKIIPVEAVRLKDYLNLPIDFLKIDIEGAETEVLEDCSEQLHRVKNIFIEYHSFAEKPQSLDKILNILKNSGFRYYLEHVGVRSKNPYDKIETYEKMDLQLNIYGVKK